MESKNCPQYCYLKLEIVRNNENIDQALALGNASPGFQAAWVLKNEGDALSELKNLKRLVY
ncbi:hypothetical protein GCM10007877_23670 [Marinibactrum halimedae]|uniref:Uncharacterized protein n=1 Tax=Marinibactrum halimedae TaxID=1444977 RepID=A0AA37TAU6_9GAMM|nr:hypothetical protein GCM10007877_23670 [Marinibactrum halimedae]